MKKTQISAILFILGLVILLSSVLTLFFAGASAKDLYQHGKLRVDGDVSVAHRLGLLKGLV